MALRCSRQNILCAFLFLCSTTFFIASYAPSYNDGCNCRGRSGSDNRAHREEGDSGVHRDAAATDNIDWGPHKIAVIIPFRNRFEELMEFAPHMHKFLNNQKIRHHIFVINQADSLRFNRASLINIGFIQSRLECDYIAMHDVDLLPQNPHLNYTYPEDGPFHLAAPEIHPMYHYPTFVGGILLINNKHFHKLNGLSNKFWGWGREDDEFYLRIKEAGLKVYRPVGIKTDSKTTFRHLHDKYQHPRDYTRYGQQRKLSKRDYFTGIDTVQYGLMSRKELSIEGSPVTILNVRLECDLESTPWCMTPEQIQGHLGALSKTDPHKAEYLHDKLFGVNGLLIPPPKSNKTATARPRVHL